MNETTSKSPEIAGDVFGQTILHRVDGAPEHDACESCGTLINRGEVRYSFDIGGGAACVCVSCRRRMVADGSAVLAQVTK